MDDFPDIVAHERYGSDTLWLVRFEGKIQSPRWNSEAAAKAFLDALQAGTRKPEPEKR